MMKRDTDNAVFREDALGRESEPTYSGALSFMRRKYSRDLDGIDLVVTGIPLDTATTNRPGARFGPRAVRAASSIMAWERPHGMAFDPFDRLAIVDYGDCFFDPGRPETVPDAIADHARRIIAQGPGLLSIGGDHFVSYPILKVHAEKFGESLSLLHFDAHSDTWADEDGRIDHGTMFFHAAKQGLVDPARSVRVGLRTHNDDTHGFNVLDAPCVHERGVERIVDEIRGILGDRPVYMTFDIDCLDPAFAPGTGTPVCGGLSTAQAMAIIRGLTGINLIGMDLVEVAPAYDVGEITALAGAHLAAEMICVYAGRPPG